MFAAACRVSCLTALATTLLACAPQTEVIKLFESSEAKQRPYERLLVVSIAADPATRRQLEDMISTQLRKTGTATVAAHTRTGPKTVLLQDEINDAARDTGSDAILVTHIVSVDMQAEKREGRVNVRAECRGGDPADYFLYDYDELKEPDTVRLAHTVVAVTNLYDATDRRRLWTIQSTCFEKETMDEVLLEEAAAIVRQLKLDGLID